MPNAPTHSLAGTLSGGTLALYRAREQAPWHQALETLGGALAGYAGGRAPDSAFIDPATLGPNHRRFGHSWVVLAGGVYVADAVISAWERFCRKRAEAAAHRLATDPTIDGLTRAGLMMLEGVWRIAAGALAGFIAGYTSHLVLDAFTARSLPAFGFKFNETVLTAEPAVESSSPSAPARTAPKSPGVRHRRRTSRPAGSRSVSAQPRAFS